MWFFVDSNVGVIYNNARCSDSPTCQTTRSSFSSFLQGIFNPVHAEINPCCGYSDDADYYSLDGGPCLPCKSFSQIHLCCCILTS